MGGQDSTPEGFLPSLSAAPAPQGAPCGLVSHLPLPQAPPATWVSHYPPRCLENFRSIPGRERLQAPSLQQGLPPWAAGTPTSGISALPPWKLRQRGGRWAAGSGPNSPSTWPWLLLASQSEAAGEGRGSQRDQSPDAVNKLSGLTLPIWGMGGDETTRLRDGGGEEGVPFSRNPDRLGRGSAGGGGVRLGQG